MGKLTAKEVQNAELETGKKLAKKFDGQGLFLLINKSGKYWRYQYRYVGRQKTLAVGTYPDISLKEARKRHQAARELLDQGNSRHIRCLTPLPASRPCDKGLWEQPACNCKGCGCNDSEELSGVTGDNVPPVATVEVRVQERGRLRISARAGMISSHQHLLLTWTPISLWCMISTPTQRL